MTNTKTMIKLDFKPLTVDTKKLYESFLPDRHERGCELSFANLICWGTHLYSVVNGNLVLLSRYGDYFVYPYPLGDGDKREIIEAMMQDAEKRGIPFRLSGLSESAKDELLEMFPDTFDLQFKDSSFDYVYSIDDLSLLAGKRYHAKRNHINRFKDAHPEYKVVPIDRDNIEAVREMTEKWYVAKLESNPDADFDHEHAALVRALDNYFKIGLDGIFIESDGEILAVTIGSVLYGDIFDVQFEKARADVQGAYTVVNFEFANYIKEKYPEIKLLDREEDMGVEGLRKAKRSYYPLRQIEKYRATRRDEVV